METKTDFKKIIANPNKNKTSFLIGLNGVCRQISLWHFLQIMVMLSVGVFTAVFLWEILEYYLIDFPGTDFSAHFKDIIASIFIIFPIFSFFSFYYWRTIVFDHKYVKTNTFLLIAQIVFLLFLSFTFIILVQKIKPLTANFKTLADYFSQFKESPIVKNDLFYFNEVVIKKDLYEILKGKQTIAVNEFVYCLYGNMFQFEDRGNILRPITNLAVINAIYPADIKSHAQEFAIYEECPPIIAEDSLIKKEINFPQNLSRVKDYLLLGTLHSHLMRQGEVILFKKQKLERCLLSPTDLFAFGYEARVAEESLKIISCLKPGQFFAYSTINPQQPLKLILIDK